MLQLKHKEGSTDVKFNLELSFVLGNDSDGINPITDNITMTVGSNFFNAVLEGGSLKESKGKRKKGKGHNKHMEWKLSKDDEIFHKVKMAASPEGVWTFSAKGVIDVISDLTLSCNVMLSVGNDRGVGLALLAHTGTKKQTNIYSLLNFTRLTEENEHETIDVGDLITPSVTLLTHNASTFVPLTSNLHFRLSDGIEFLPNITYQKLSVNGVSVENAMTVFGSDLIFFRPLSDGPNNIAFKGQTVDYATVYFSVKLWAGNTNFTVVVRDYFGSLLAVDSVNVTVAVAEDQSVIATAQTINGTAQVSHVPEVTLVFKAIRLLPSGDVDIFYGGGHGLDGAKTLIFTQALNVSDINNNDFANGTLEGWSADDSANIISHNENPGPTAVSNSSTVEFAAYKVRNQRNSAPHSLTSLTPTATRHLHSRLLLGTNYDMILHTSGQFREQVVGRSFATPAGTTSVIIRYRFETTEIPGGYFGSKYNDYFRVQLRSQSSGQVFGISSSMNALGYDAFNPITGSTAWYTGSIETDIFGDVVEVEIAVSNVVDDIFDSAVIVDFIEEISNTVLSKLEWDSISGGLKWTYEIVGDDLQSAEEFALYWASSTSLSSRKGFAGFRETLPMGLGVGTKNSVSISASVLKGGGGAYLMLVRSSSHVSAVIKDISIDLSRVDPDTLSSKTIAIIKDNLRASGNTNSYVTRTFVNARRQAVAMFNNLNHNEKMKAYPKAEEWFKNCVKAIPASATLLQHNVAYQYCVYAPSGDQVVALFEAETLGMTRVQILSIAGTLIDKMVAKIEILGCENVSKHCSDFSKINVLDIGQNSFKSLNNAYSLMATSLANDDRLSSMDENSAFHIIVPQ